MPTAAPSPPQSDIKINGLGLTDHIILSILLLIFAIVVVVGSSIYCCIRRKSCCYREKPIDQNDKLNVQNSTLDEHAAGSDVEMDAREAAHDEDTISGRSSISGKANVSL
jgi:hypothetical protein